MRRTGRVLRTVMAASVILITAAPAWADSMTWEMDGAITSVSGVFTSFLAVGMPVTLDLFGDAAQVGFANCPPGSPSTDFTVGAELRAGSLAYSGSGLIERNNEEGACGLLGPHLDLQSFFWSFDGTPPDQSVFALEQVYAFMTPYSTLPTTLGEQLDSVNAVGGGATGLFPGGFTFSGPLAPVPEPATGAIFATGVIVLARLRKGRRRQTTTS